MSKVRIDKFGVLRVEQMMKTSLPYSLKDGVASERLRELVVKALLPRRADLKHTFAIVAIFVLTPKSV